MDLLPIELWELIAKKDNTVYKTLTLVFRDLGLKSLSVGYSDDMKRIFLRKKTTSLWCIKYFLPNGDAHNFEEPSINNCGDQYWYKHDQFHRDNDLPAVICAIGNMRWYKNGECHREHDQPAIILADGTKTWYVHGKFISL